MEIIVGGPNEALQPPIPETYMGPLPRGIHANLPDFTDVVSASSRKVAQMDTVATIADVCDVGASVAPNANNHGDVEKGGIDSTEQKCSGRGWKCKLHSDERWHLISYDYGCQRGSGYTHLLRTCEEAMSNGREGRFV